MLVVKAVLPALVFVSLALEQIRVAAAASLLSP
jgi:hypothetical protein